MLQKRNIKDQGFINFEKRFIKSLSIVAIVMAIAGFAINLFLDFNFKLVVVPFIAIGIFALTYIWAKKGVKLLQLKIVVTFITFCLTNFLWYFNYGSHGPAPYFFIITFSLLIFIWRKRALLIVTTILFSNIAAIFAFEYINPDFIKPYDTNMARIIDSYTGTIMYGVFIFVLLRNAKNYLIKEYQKAIESDQLKTAFLENMSHEIRTPLNAIVGFSGMIAQGDLHPSQKADFASIIDINNDLLLRLIDDILDMSKIESNTFEVKTKKCHLNPILEVLKSTYEHRVNESKKDVKFKMILPDEEYFTDIDGTRVNQVLTNLIDNAIKFTESGLILVNISYQKKHFKFTIQDTGIGIKEEEKEKIFDRFFKGTSTNEELYRGTGIGLYLSSKIVDLLGGSLWVESKVGMGSTFCFTIPCINTEVRQFEQKEILKTEITDIKKIVTSPKNDTSSKILIVEDNHSNLMLIETFLLKWGYEYLTAMSGEEAMEIFNKTEDIDLVLLDINLPGISGYDVFHKMKAARSKTIIIAQTAYAMKEDEDRCKEIGFDGFVRKPIEPHFLKLHLRHHLKTKQ